ncbi:MAG: S8 family serine peptidase [Candidatus Sericytochromatia bacterium]
MNKIFYIPALLITSIISCTNISTIKNTNIIKNENELYKDFIEKRNKDYIEKFKKKIFTNIETKISIDTNILNKDKNNFYTLSNENKTKNSDTKKIVEFKHNTNQAHINHNDYNIFDINDVSKLNLEPYDGDIVDSSGAKISAIKINNIEQEVKIQPYILGIKFKNTTGLNTFKNLYNATILREAFGYYILQIDPKKAPLSKIYDLMKKYNAGLAENIETISFSSIASLQTFTIGIDFLTNYYDLIESIEWATVAEAREQYSTEYNFDGGLYGYFKGTGVANKEIITGKSIQSWWSAASNLNDVIKYNIATGNGLKASIIEPLKSFVINTEYMKDSNGNSRYIINKYLDNNKNDLDENILNYTKPSTEIINNNDTANLNYITFGGMSLTGKYHSYLSSVVGFGSEINKNFNNVSIGSFNNININYHTRGVAPNAKVLPFVTNSPLFWSSDIGFAMKENVSVVSISAGLSFPGNTLSNIASWVIPGLGATLSTFMAPSSFYEAIKIASNNNIPVVISSGNDSQNNKFDYPSNSPNCIAAGAISPEFTSSRKDNEHILYAPVRPCIFNPNIPESESNNRNKCFDFDPNIPERIFQNNFFENAPSTNPIQNFVLSLGKFSNYGENVIYVPGEYIFVPNPDPAFPHYTHQYGGTSAAAPYLAAVITLFKEIDPNITISQIKESLTKSSTINVYPSAYAVRDNYPTDKIKMLNVFDAVIDVAKRAGKIYLLDNNAIKNINSSIFSINNNTIIPNNNKNIPVSINDQSANFGIAVAGDLDSTKVYVDDNGTKKELDILEKHNNLLICRTKLKSISNLGNKNLILESRNSNLEIKDALLVKESEIKPKSIKDPSTGIQMAVIYPKPETPVPVAPNQTIALALTESQAKAIKGTLSTVSIGGWSIYADQMVGNYLKASFPSDIYNINNKDIRDIVIKAAQTLNYPDITFEKAVAIVSLAYGYNPDDPITIAGKVIYPQDFIKLNPYKEPEKAVSITNTSTRKLAFAVDGIQNLADATVELKDIITGVKTTLPISGGSSPYYTFDIPNNMTVGYKDVTIKTKDGVLLFSNSVNIKETGKVTSIDTAFGPARVVEDGADASPDGLYAVPVSKLIRDDLGSAKVTIAGKDFTILDIVQNYAIFKLDKSAFLDPDFVRTVKNTIQSILIRRTNVDFTIETIQDALKIIVEESRINVNFNSMLLNSLANYLSLMDLYSLDQKRLYNGNALIATINRQKTKVAFIPSESYGSPTLSKVNIIELDETGGTTIKSSKSLRK